MTKNYKSGVVIAPLEVVKAYEKVEANDYLPAELKTLFDFALNRYKVTKILELRTEDSIKHLSLEGGYNEDEGDYVVIGDLKIAKKDNVTSVTRKLELPEYETEDVGKVLKVGDDGLEWGESGGSSESLFPVVAIGITPASTMRELFVACGLDPEESVSSFSSKEYYFLNKSLGIHVNGSQFLPLFRLRINNYGSKTWILHYYGDDFTRDISVNNLDISLNDATTSITRYSMPMIPSQTGTYVLKCVNGTATWVEETN